MANTSKDNKKDSESELQIKFKEELSKPYYKVDYLDSFKLPSEKLDVSVIIPTYNRCPYKPNTLRAELNPLSWAIKSILLQKPRVNEIIIVDDFSSDYTEQVVNLFKKEAEDKQVKLIYFKNKKHVGYTRIINNGASLANSKYLMLVDDDSIVAPYSAFGAVYSFEWLESQGVKVGIMNLSPYSRTSFPNKIVASNMIGNLDFAEGSFTTNKNAFPEEYLEEKKQDKFIHSEYHILKPIQIKNSGGYFLCQKKFFIGIEGFPETIYERYMDTEFGCKTLENGYSIYHSPDPKFQCVHGSYGLKLGRGFEGDEWFKRIGGNISLKRAMDECDNPKENTGCRIDLNKVMYNSILSFFCMTYKRNVRGAVKWMKKVKTEFVNNGNVSIVNGDINNIPSSEERKEMFNRAMRVGLKFIESTEREKLKKIKEIKNKIEHENEAEGSILDLMSESLY